jgi:hypothetical protein
VCREKAVSVAIPAIMWVGSTGSGIGGVAIGFYANRNEVSFEDLWAIDGFEVAWAVPDVYRSKFENRILDFNDGKWLLA